jgi:hypothetical protein
MLNMSAKTATCNKENLAKISEMIGTTSHMQAGDLPLESEPAIF